MKKVFAIVLFFCVAHHGSARSYTEITFLAPSAPTPWYGGDVHVTWQFNREYIHDPARFDFRNATFTLTAWTLFEDQLKVFTLSDTTALLQLHDIPADELIVVLRLEGHVKNKVTGKTVSFTCSELALKRVKDNIPTINLLAGNNSPADRGKLVMEYLRNGLFMDAAYAYFSDTLYRNAAYDSFFETYFQCLGRHVNYRLSFEGEVPGIAPARPLVRFREISLKKARLTRAADEKFFIAKVVDARVDTSSIGRVFAAGYNPFRYRHPIQAIAIFSEGVSGALMKLLSQGQKPHETKKRVAIYVTKFIINEEAPGLEVAKLIFEYQVTAISANGEVRLFTTSDVIERSGVEVTVRHKQNIAESLNRTLQKLRETEF